MDSEVNVSPLCSASTDDSGVATLVMNDAPRKNALSLEMAAELEDRFRDFSRNESIKAIVLTGLDEYFSTGANREVLQQITSGKATPRDLLLPRVLLDVETPVIAAMSGHALGGGLALGICADLTVIARESRYGATFINLGFTPGMGLTRLLEHALGVPTAHEMLLTGQAFRGSHLENRGAFNYVVPRKEVLKKAQELAALLAEKPRTAMTALKLSLSSKKRQLFEEARTAECLMHQITFFSPEVDRAIREMAE
jgi:polyketide biosynthesis enoyl-CoA hydratase PksI